LNISFYRVSLSIRFIKKILRFKGSIDLGSQISSFKTSQIKIQKNIFHNFHSTHSPQHALGWREIFSFFFHIRFVNEKLSCIRSVRIVHVEIFCSILNCWWLQKRKQKGIKKHQRKTFFQVNIHEPLHNVHVMCIRIFPMIGQLLTQFIFGQLVNVVLLTFYYVLNSIAQPIKFVTKLSNMKCRNFSVFNDFTGNFLVSLGMKCTWKYFRSPSSHSRKRIKSH
jgi:hypothetical protein